MERISYHQLQEELTRVLLTLSFSEEKANICSKIFTDNTLDGIASHGINRFPVFVNDVKRGLVVPSGTAERKEKYGVLENWDGHRGPGMSNASICMDRAIRLAKTGGIGGVVLGNNNHWMRGGTYGWQAAEAGCIGLCFTNAQAGLPPWGGKEPRLGNNPLVLAVPREKGSIVLDMALSQYSYGKMQEYAMSEQELPFAGGYDGEGKMTKDPKLVMESKRALPIGLWKGSGLALMLDVVLTALSGGRSTKNITQDEGESGGSQCFIAIYKEALYPALVEEILKDVKSATPVEEGGAIYYPGERTLQRREENRKLGIPVREEIWENIKQM